LLKVKKKLEVKKQDISWKQFLKFKKIIKECSKIKYLRLVLIVNCCLEISKWKK